MAMRKQILIVITLSILIVMLVALHFFLGLFTPYNYLTAKWDIAHKNPQILQYGESRLTDKQAIEIAPKFGFSFDFVADSYITTALVNGIKAYNAVTIKHLNTTLGNNWQQDFDFQIDSAFREERTDTIKKVVLALNPVREMNQYLDSLSHGKERLHVWVRSQIKQDANVRIGRIMPDSSIQILYYYQVDPYSLDALQVQH